MLILNVTICNPFLAGHGKQTVQTPSIRCRKEKTHSIECVFLLETGIYISSRARVRVTLRPFARHQKIKYNSPRNCAFPKMPYYHKYFPKPFSDAFAFGRVLLFANFHVLYKQPFLFFGRILTIIAK